MIVSGLRAVSSKDSQKNKVAILGVEAPGRQGANTQDYLDIPAFSQRQPDGMYRRLQSDVVVE